MEEQVNKVKRTSFMTSCVVAVTLVLLASIYNLAKEPPKQKGKAETIECTASGTSTQMGQTVGVTIIIDELSTEADKQILVAAFQKGGNQALCNAVSKMHSKGRLAITGTVGYDVNYIREFPMPNGRKIRAVTDRPITFGEAWGDTRSMDYNLSALEMDISNEKGKSTGKLLPACQLTINKKTNEMEIETFQNPWNMVGFIDWNKPQ
jgi:hypothetical protein